MPPQARIWNESLQWSFHPRGDFSEPCISCSLLWTCLCACDCCFFIFGITVWGFHRFSWEKAPYTIKHLTIHQDITSKNSDYINWYILPKKKKYWLIQTSLFMFIDRYHVSSMVLSALFELIILIPPTPYEEDTSITLFYRWGPEMLNNLPVTLQLVGDKIGIQTQTVGLQCHNSLYSLYLITYTDTSYLIFCTVLSQLTLITTWCMLTNILKHT